MRSPRRPGQGHSWAELEKADDLPIEEKQIDAIFARTFLTADGQKTLEYFHLLTTFKRSQPNAPEGALREDEAMRRFVAIIEARIARHLKGTKQDGGRTRRRRQPAAAG